jgi:hypothetical protein
MPWDKYGEYEEPHHSANNFTLTVVEPSAPRKRPNMSDVFADPDSLAAFAKRRAISLTSAVGPSRITAGLTLMRNAALQSGAPKHTNFLDELVQLVSHMPVTLRPNGKRTHPWTPSEIEVIVWRNEQWCYRQARIKPPEERIFTSPTPNRAPTATGVPGVKYATLPHGSMHKDPGHKPHRPPTDPVWIFDTGAGIPGFNNRYGLTSFAPLAKPVIVGGIVAEKNLTVGTGAVLDNIDVLYDERFGANCLPSSVIVDAGWKVKYYDNADCYVVTTASKKRLIFQRFIMANGSVTKHYLFHPGLPLCDPTPHHVIAATSVQGNLSMHSKQDAKSAAVAQRFLTKMGGSSAHGLVRLPMLRGIDITADHVRKAQAIYGPVRSHAQSAATAVQDVPVTNELPSERMKPVPQALAVDLVFIMGVWVVLGIFLPCRYMAVAAIKDRSAPVIYSAMRNMILSAMKKNFDVVKVQADGEKGIHSPELDDLCAKHHIETLKVGAGQHEANVERSARTLKAEVRNIAQRVIPRSLPRELLEQLIIASATSVNARLSSALVGDKSPQQIWSGADHVYAQDHDLAFGDLAIASCPNQKNNVDPRADTVMVLYPIYNGLHGYQVYKLGTGAYVVRNHNTLKEVPWTRGDQAAIESLGDRDPHGFDMPSREQGISSGVPTGSMPVERGIS